MFIERRLRSAWASAQSDQFSLSTRRRNLSSLATQWVHSEDWSDWADAHVDLILPWESSHFVGFVMRWLGYGKNRLNQQADYLRTYWRSGSVTRASGLLPGGCGFDPQSHTKDFKNSISCSFVCVQHWESGTGRSGVSIMWLVGMSRHVSEVWYVSEAALLKWAHDWKIVESDVKSQQENIDAKHQYTGKLICHALLSSL